MTEGREQPELVTTWKAEQHWFRWTAAVACCLAASVLGWLGTRYWVVLKDQEIEKAFGRLVSTMHSSRIDPEKVGEAVSHIEVLKASVSPIRSLGSTLGIVSIFLGLGLSTTLIKWLLAIRARRKMQMSVGFQEAQDL